jgi:uncharacterized SAM-binding protein YcdF (DUF218 family)
VLGGGTGADRSGTANFGNSGDRVAYAAELYRKGMCRRLGCSGATIPGMHESRSLADDTAALWIALGIPDQDIVRIETPARITATEVASIQDECRRRGFTRVGLLTSGWHLPRSLSHCRRLGFTVIPIAAERSGPLPSLAPIWIIPQGAGFEAVQLALWERLGRLIGR